MSGYVIGRATVDRVEVLLRRDSGIRLGDFVVLEDGDLRAMGIVDHMESGHRIASEGILSQEAVEQLAKEREMGAFSIAMIRVLGVIKDGKLGGLPKRPISVLSEVRKARPAEISSILQKGHLEIGHVLSDPSIKVKIDVNRMVARHLAILSMTGGGKSNTVALLASELGKMGGTVVILDFHNEYVVTGNRFGDAPAFVIDPKLNPRQIEPEKLIEIIGLNPNATNQRTLFHQIYEYLKSRDKPLLQIMSKILEDMAKGEGFPEELNEVYDRFKGKKDSIYGLKNRIDYFLKRHKSILNDRASKVIDMIQEEMVNIVRVGLLPDYVIDVFVGTLLSDILLARKAYFLTKEDHHTSSDRVLKKPIFVILEEAHILVDSKRKTMTKDAVIRIAREGRKFGVGLALVSQRPSSMDQDVLSQMNSIIALRMISKKDKNAVAEASDQVDEAMVESLSSLNPGEALLIGPFVPFPFFAKIRKVEGLLSSSDPDIVGEWDGREEEGVKDDSILL
ncbi:MAG: hypothetical protein DRN14_03370 [Thermoplasmata archaeon]|nr:MAG: hypothetical protein DRN14_03370 [Thermoplasmata archaeon]